VLTPAGKHVCPASAPAQSSRLRLRLSLLGALVTAVAALGWVVAVALTGPAAAPTLRVRDRLESLPVAAQGPVSAALGRDRPAYRVLGLRAVNPAQHLHVVFARRGVTVVSGGSRVAIALSAYGYGDLLQPLGPVIPHVSGNRVGYPHRSLTEWFMNGPLGLEQGFDIAARPSLGSGPLTLSLMLSGNLYPRLRRGSLSLTGDGVSLRYGSLLATDARGRVLPSWLMIAVRHTPFGLTRSSSRANWPPGTAPEEKNSANRLRSRAGRLSWARPTM
jgi:hypothetical protein